MKSGRSYRIHQTRDQNYDTLPQEHCQFKPINESYIRNTKKRLGWLVTEGEAAGREIGIRRADARPSAGLLSGWIIPWR
jgi:hypothetical protein